MNLFSKCHYQDAPLTKSKTLHPELRHVLLERLGQSPVLLTVAGDDANKVTPVSVPLDAFNLDYVSLTVHGKILRYLCLEAYN